MVLGSLGAGVEHVALRQLAAVELKLKAHLARLSALEIHIDEQIVGRVEAHEGVDTRMGVVGRDLGVAYALAIDHELERGIIPTYQSVGSMRVIFTFALTERSAKKRRRRVMVLFINF